MKDAIYSIDMGGGKSSCRVMTNFSPTLDCAHQGEPVICKCFIIDPIASNTMKSNNPHSGFHKEERSMTIDTTTPCPQKGQGGLVIVEVKQ